MGHECLYVNKEKQLFLSVYVDDFKMAGKASNITPMWKVLGRDLELDPPVTSTKAVYLGCAQAPWIPDAGMVQNKQLFYKSLYNPKPVAGGDSTLSGDDGDINASKPESSLRERPLRREEGEGIKSSKPEQIKGWTYSMCGHSQQCVEKYLQLTGKDVSTLKMVATPCIDDHMLNEEDMQEKGELHVNAARIVLKVLYVARVNRPDIYWAVNTLAREVTKWTKACDRRVHRLISYLYWTTNYHQKCWVGDDPQNCVLALFVDASFAGYLGDSISSTGAMMCLVGPNTFVPVQWLCKKQTAVSHSSTEAEVIALDTGVRLDGIPALIFWELVIEVLGPRTKGSIASGDTTLTQANKTRKFCNGYDVLNNVDWVPPSLPP